MLWMKIKKIQKEREGRGGGIGGEGKKGEGWMITFARFTARLAMGYQASAERGSKWFFAANCSRKRLLRCLLSQYDSK